MVEGGRACVRHNGGGAVSEVGRAPDRRNIRVRYIPIFAILTVALMVTLISFKLTGVSVKDCFDDFVEKLGLGRQAFDSNNGGGITLLPPTEHETNDDISDGMLESEGRETKDTELESESEGTWTEDENAEKIELVVYEMSATELGDAYFINYSVQNPDIEAMLASGFDGERHNYTEKPVVMIVHSYTMAGYEDMDKEDRGDIIRNGVVAVGAAISEGLTSHGIPCLHITVIHDSEREPYAAARETIKTMLDVYPSVELVIDLGRMELRDEDGRHVKLLNSDGEAQIRLTASTNGRTWREDMTLALALRSALNDNNKKRCLPVTLSDGRYSSGESRYYLKIDIGTDANTSAEARLAAGALTNAIIKVMKK